MSGIRRPIVRPHRPGCDAWRSCACCWQTQPPLQARSATIRPALVLPVAGRPGSLLRCPPMHPGEPGYLEGPHRFGQTIGRARWRVGLQGTKLAALDCLQERRNADSCVLSRLSRSEARVDLEEHSRSNPQCGRKPLLHAGRGELCTPLELLDVRNTDSGALSELSHRQPLRSTFRAKSLPREAAPSRFRPAPPPMWSSGLLLHIEDQAA